MMERRVVEQALERELQFKTNRLKGFSLSMSKMERENLQNVDLPTLRRLLNELGR